MHRFRFMLAIVLALRGALALAQDAAPGPAGRVEVSSTRDPELRSYAQMRKGLEAYRDKHALAPGAQLQFILIPKSTGVDLQGLKMRLASDDDSIDIPIDAGGRFSLPLIEQKRDDEYDLILNQPKGRFRIRPDVKSPGLPPDTKRLGDLRLECEVRWAIERQDVTKVFLTYVNLVGTGNPCSSRSVAVNFVAPAGIDGVTLEAPDRNIALKVHGYEHYSLPLWDTRLSDDAPVRYHGAAAPATGLTPAAPPGSH